MIKSVTEESNVQSAYTETYHNSAQPLACCWVLHLGVGANTAAIQTAVSVLMGIVHGETKNNQILKKT